jgi:hypothetical protein
MPFKEFQSRMAPPTNGPAKPSDDHLIVCAAQCDLSKEVFMHTYEFTFKCERCAKELTEIVTSPDVLAKEELNQMEFHPTCPNASCRWSGTRTGAHAEKIKAALKPMSVCG